MGTSGSSSLNFTMTLTPVAFASEGSWDHSCVFVIPKSDFVDGVPDSIALRSVTPINNDEYRHTYTAWDARGYDMEKSQFFADTRTSSEVGYSSDPLPTDRAVLIYNAIVNRSSSLLAPNIFRTGLVNVDSDTAYNIETGWDNYTLDGFTINDKGGRAGIGVHKMSGESSSLRMAWSAALLLPKV